MPSEPGKNFDFVVTLFTKPIYPEKVPRMTPEEAQAFVEGLVNGSVFTSRHIHEVDKAHGDLGRVFLCHAGDFFKGLPNDFLHDIGIVWAFMKEQTGKTYKGSVTKTSYPTFMVCRLCSRDDWDVAVAAVAAQKKETGLVLPS